MNKILITGGAGFIGSHIVNRFLDKKYKVFVIDSLEKTSNLNRINGEVELISERIENIKNIPKVDIVINSAADTHVDYSFNNPLNFINSNIIGLHNLAMLCVDRDVPIIHLSTDEVIGTGEDLYENSMLKPTNPYAFTKCAGENLLHAYGYSYNLNWKIIRLNNIYGKAQFPDKLIPKFIYHILNNEKLPLHGNGRQTRNFLNVTDFVNAVEIIINRGNTKNIYNVSTDEEYSIIEVTKMICDIMGVNFENNISWVEDRPFNDPCYHSKSDKLRKLGWKPNYSLIEYMEELIEWYVNNVNFFNKNNNDVI